MLNLMEALLVCEDTKTLAALQRQFIAAPDASNMADDLRISPWQAAALRLRTPDLNSIASVREGLGTIESLKPFGKLRTTPSGRSPAF